MDHPNRKARAQAARRRRRAHYARWTKKTFSGISPNHASTQTWMILTFALFVGIAVVVVGLYVAYVMESEVRRAVYHELYENAQRIAVLMEQADSDAQRAELVNSFSRMTGLHVSAAFDGEVFTGDQGDPVIKGMFPDLPAGPIPASALVPLSRQDNDDLASELHVAIYQPAADFTVRVAGILPIRHGVMRRVEAALAAGMVLILLLSLFGSWVAARHVITPLRAIRDSAQSISEGKFDEKIKVESRAVEFQDLAQILNLMSASFRDKIKEMQRLAQLQNEFIGNVSHEVRNPIFAVSGYLEALSTPNLKEDLRKRYSEKGLANLQRLNNLFNDLIEIAKLEYREDLINLQVFDLQELLEEISEMLRPKAREKGLMLEIENPHVSVEADRNRIRQVLINLIDNAIAYTDSGTVRCRFRRRLDKVRVEVIDTGRGIPEEHLDRIFERFYRVDPDRSRKSGGTGLGLSIVKQILHAHGEPIHVESTYGRGTRFWFELPFAQQAEEIQVA